MDYFDCASPCIDDYNEFDWLKHDDKLYSILSKKIMIEMNKYKIK